MKFVYGIDFGSSQITICEKNMGFVLSEPCLIEKIFEDDNTTKYGSVGIEAKKIMNKTLPNSVVTSPIKNSVIVDKEAMTKLMLELFKKVVPKYKMIKPEIEFYVLAECGLSVEENSDIREICYKVGADKVTFIPSALCALYGTDKEKSFDSKFCCVDIGADTAKFYICNKNEVIQGFSVNIAGNKLNEMIDLHAKGICNVELTPKQIESLKVSILSLIESNKADMEIQCKSIDSYELVNVCFSSSGLYEIPKFYFDKYIEYINNLINEFETDRQFIMKNGLIVYGGTSKILGVKEYLEQKLKFPVLVANKDNIALIGLMKILKNKHFLKNVLV